jgi:hypothetical protein
MLGRKDLFPQNQKITASIREAIARVLRIGKALCLTDPAATSLQHREETTPRSVTSQAWPLIHLVIHLVSATILLCTMQVQIP